MCKDTDPDMARVRCVDAIDLDLRRLAALADFLSESLEAVQPESITTAGGMIQDIADRLKENTDKLQDMPWEGRSHG